MAQFIETFYADPWLKFMIDATIKSLVILVVAGLLQLMFRRKSAALRGLVWCLAVVGCLIVPLCSLMLPKWEVGVLPASPVAFEDNSQLITPSVPIERRLSLPATVPSLQPTPMPSPVPPQPATNRYGIFSSLDWTDWLVVAWAVGAMLLLARLVIGIATVGHISFRSTDFCSAIEPSRFNCKRQVRVRKSNAVTVPMVWGFFRPTILLPANADNWQEERLRAVLLHELAHIRRCDWLAKTIAGMACAVYWFNPLVWLAARRMWVEAEKACDDGVLNGGFQSTDYAEHLLSVARNLKVVGSVSRAAVAMASRSRIEVRLRAILATNLNRHPVTRVIVATGLLILGVVAVPMGAMRLVEAVDQEEVLYREIQAVFNYRPEELLPRPRLLGPPSASEKMEKYGQGWEMALELCEKFLNVYPNSQQHDTVWYEQLNYLFGLQRNAEFDAGAEAFLSEHPSSKYANRLRRFLVYRFMDEQKFDLALAELDKIDDPAMQHEVYERKADVYMELQDYLKMAESYLLRADLILGKPAPHISHVSMDGGSVSLQSFRGKVVMLYYWSTGDKSTQGEIPTLKRLYKLHRENPDFVLIPVCTHSTKTELKQFLKTYEMPRIHLLLEPEMVPYQFGVVPLLNYLPHYVLLDKTGMIRVADHAFLRADFKFEHWVIALLAEDTIVDSERIIPQRQQFLAEYYLVKNQTEDSIAEYKKSLAFTPNNLDIMLDILDLRVFPSTDTELMNRAYNRLLELDQLHRLSPELNLSIDFYALWLARLFGKRGGRDKEKTWTLFQIAVAHDRNAMRINSVRQNKEFYRELTAVLQDNPEFQKLLAHTPQNEMGR